jgi:hypothetical protein
VVRQKILDVIHNPKAKFLDGEQAWAALMPYLWEKAFLRRNYPQIST